MTGWVVETLGATTLLMLLVLALREPVARRYGAAAAYLLWLAPALRMLLPPLPPGWLGVRDDAVGTVVTLLGSPASVGGGAAAFPPPTPDWPPLLFALWIGGAGLFFVWHWLRYVRFVRRARQSADWLYAEETIEIASSPAIASPIAFGVFGKVVMIPANFTSHYDPLEQRLVLAHEVAHHRRHDLPVNLAGLVMLSLHWFNPVAHWAHRAFRIDQEAACDAQVLAGASARERHAYGTALFKSATARTPFAACAMGAAPTIKTRLSRIVSGQSTAATPPMQTGLTATLAAAILLTASTGIVTAMPDDAAPQASPILIAGERISAHAAMIAAPAAPAVPPAVPVVGTVSPRVTIIPSPPAAIAAPAQEVPEAQVAPAPLSQSLSHSAALLPAPAATMAVQARHLACANGANPQILSGAATPEGQARREIRIVVCRATSDRPATEAMRDALTSARSRIANDQVIEAVLRDRLLIAIDRQIAEADRRQAAASAVPLYSLQ